MSRSEKLGEEKTLGEGIGRDENGSNSGGDI